MRSVKPCVVYKSVMIKLKDLLIISVDAVIRCIIFSVLSLCYVNGKYYVGTLPSIYLAILKSHVFFVNYRRFSFCQYPFILSMSAKKMILQRDSEHQMLIMAKVKGYLHCVLIINGGFPS